MSLWVVETRRKGHLNFVKRVIYIKRKHATAKSKTGIISSEANDGYYSPGCFGRWFVRQVFEWIPLVFVMCETVLQKCGHPVW